MPRVAVIADSHFDRSSRFEECIRVHDFIAEDIAREGCDLAVHTGDIYERASTPEERRAVAAWVKRVTETCPLVIVRGNHDAPRDLEILSRLDTEHPVIVEEAAAVHVVGGFVVAALAWPSKASVLALARDRAWSHDEGEQVAGAALRAVLMGLGNEMEAAREARGMASAPKLLVSHAMVRGSKVSTGQPLVGCDLELGLEDLALANAHANLLGHIHMPQEWEGLPTTIYPGSPRRTAFGEVEEKGYVIADFDSAAGGELVAYRRVPTPCAPMVLVSATFENDPALGQWLAYSHPGLTDAVCAGAEVRVRYTVKPDEREAARAKAEALRAELLEAGAIDVKLEERVIAKSEARAPEVATATTLADKLHALWKARAQTPEPERAEALITMATTLESEERAA